MRCPCAEYGLPMRGVCSARARSRASAHPRSMGVGELRGCGAGLPTKERAIHSSPKHTCKPCTCMRDGACTHLLVAVAHKGCKEPRDPLGEGGIGNSAKRFPEHIASQGTEESNKAAGKGRVGRKLPLKPSSGTCMLASPSQGDRITATTHLQYVRNGEVNVALGGGVVVLCALRARVAHARTQRIQHSRECTEQTCWHEPVVDAWARARVSIWVSIWISIWVSTWVSTCFST